MTTRRRVLGAGVALLASALTLTACGGGGSGDAPAKVDPNAPVTISIGNKPTSEQKEQLASFERRYNEFTKANPNITINAEETKWEADTFQALLAGGQLPTVIPVPFTEIRGLIEREQVADVTDYLGAYPNSLAAINPSVMKQVQNTEGRAYGVPYNAYSMGLIYNRDLFTKAGLDPDSPPATWDEVRTAAKAITDKTDAQGFQTMTTDATGGWALTTTSYGFGGTVQSEDGKTATLDNAATKQALAMYKEMRWTDNSMGSNFLLNYEDAATALAAGKVGMYVMGSDAWNTMVANKGMKGDAFGLGPLPQAANGIGTLAGGSIYIINPTATPEQITAAMKWIDFFQFRKYTDEAVAVSDAKATAADGLGVGAPALPILSKESNDRYLGWIKAQINVPREHFTDYLDAAETLPLVPEPTSKAQEIYQTLDPVVQAVLTREDADIDTLLAAAQKTAQAAIDAG